MICQGIDFSEGKVSKSSSTAVMYFIHSTASSWTDYMTNTSTFSKHTIFSLIKNNRYHPQMKARKTYVFRIWQQTKYHSSLIHQAFSDSRVSNKCTTCVRSETEADHGRSRRFFGKRHRTTRNKNWQRKYFGVANNDRGLTNIAQIRCKFSTTFISTSGKYSRGCKQWCSKYYLGEVACTAQ